MSCPCRLVLALSARTTADCGRPRKFPTTMPRCSTAGYSHRRISKRRSPGMATSRGSAPEPTWIGLSLPLENRTSGHGPALHLGRTLTSRPLRPLISTQGEPERAKARHSNGDGGLQTRRDFQNSTRLDEGGLAASATAETPIVSDGSL